MVLRWLASNVPLSSGLTTSHKHYHLPQVSVYQFSGIGDPAELTEEVIIYNFGLFFIYLVLTGHLGTFQVQ